MQFGFVSGIIEIIIMETKKLQKDAEEIEMGALPQRLEREKYGQYP